MLLTGQQRTHRDLDKFPTAQLFLLAICRVAEPIALTSVFPYAWKLCLKFHVGDKSDASFYAGILISAFALAESLTGMFWGGVSDRIGRKPVLIIGCTGTLISLLVVGLATNFWWALFGRALGGLLNGNIGVIQTMVGELVSKPEHEPKAYAVMPFVWSIGTIIGPAIGGWFADPSENFPGAFSPTGIFAKFPYLLPNLICAALLAISIVVSWFFLVETHPDKQTWNTFVDVNRSQAETPLMATAGATEHAGVDLRAQSYGTFNAVDITETETVQVNSDGSALQPAQLAAGPAQTVFTKRVLMITAALGIFTYHSMTYDHLLPIFLQDERNTTNAEMAASALDIPGGLGLTTQSVGLIMSVNGVIALVIQGAISAPFISYLGVWRAFVILTILHPIAYFIVPYLAALPDNALYPGIYACLTVRNIFSIIVYPCLLILLKEACPSPKLLGQVNGLAASAGAACRTLAPPIAGYLYSLGARQGFTGLAWWGSGLVALAGAIQCWFVPQQKNKTAHVHSIAALLTEDYPETKPEVIHILVDDVDEEV
ncbi:MAG: hypothetical protein M4579_005430 [Chaenotheca gracillima]|nr:MAG: hypothetical protein M4579_005430 [Chaenotheca gracillima]